MTKAQADNEELKRLKTEGEWVEVASVTQVVADMGVAIKNKMRALPTKIGPRVAGMNAAQATQELREGIDEALTELGRAFLEV